MNRSASSKNDTSATSGQPPRATLSERDLIAQETATAKSAIRTVWRELIGDVKRCPRQVIEDHPWGVVLGFASTGAVIGATGAARRQRAKKRAAEHDESRGGANGRVPREQAAAGRHEYIDAALRELARLLLHVAPAFLLGLREGSHASENADDTGVVP